MLEGLDERHRYRLMIYQTLRGALRIFLLFWGLVIAPNAILAQGSAWDGLINAGREALRQNAFSEAERYFEDALELAENFPQGDPRLGRSLNNLAALYYKQEDYDRAEPLMRRSLAVLEETLGPDDADVAQTKKNLAAIYYLQENFTDAEPLLIESLATLEDIHGPNHAFVATILNHLAVLYQAQARYADAEPLLERSLQIWESLLGKDNADVVKSRELLARLREANQTVAAQSNAENEEEDVASVREPRSQSDLLPPAAADQIIALANEAEEEVDKDLENAARALQNLAASELAAARADQAAGINATVLPTPGVLTVRASEAAEPEIEDDSKFAIYLSTVWSADEAMRYWKALKEEVPDILAEKRMEIEEIAIDDGNGSFYRVLTSPFSSDPAAQQACEEIRSQIRTHDCNVVAR